MTFPDNFVKQPFLLLTSAFCLGIVSKSDFLTNYSAILFFISLAIFGFFVLVWKNSQLVLLSILALFYMLGNLLIKEVSDSSLSSNFQDVYQPGKVVEGEVLEVSRSEKLWNKAIIDIKYIHQAKEKIPVKEKVLFLVQTDSISIKKGDVLMLNSEISAIQNKGNPGEFDAVQFWKAKGISKIAFLNEAQQLKVGNNQSFVEKWFNDLDMYLSKIFEGIVHPDAVGVAKALVLGDRDHLDSETVRAFGNTGAMHVLAVSGLHIGLILNMLMYFFALFPQRISKYQATVLALVILWFYAVLTGFSPSVIRAVVMFSMLTFAKLSGRNHKPLNVLFASALVILIYDPVLLYDLGFQLSYLAMLGIFLIYKPIVGLFYIRNKWMRLVWEGTAVSLAAQVFTLPLTLFCFHQFPNYFLIANIGMILFSNIILLIGVLLCLLHFVPVLNAILAWGLSFLVVAMFVFVQWVDSIPGSTAAGFVFSPVQVVLLYAAIGITLLSFQWKNNWRFVSMLAVIGICITVVWSRFRNSSQNEFVVFNNSKLIACLKMEEEIHCFYEHEKQLPRAKFMAESYAKLRSGKIKYCQIKPNQKVNLKNTRLNFQFTNSFHQCGFEINGKSYAIVKNILPEKDSNEESNKIYMPWIELSDVAGHQLREGAFVLPINSTPSTKPRSKATV